jgi:hypothetical protein
VGCKTLAAGFGDRHAARYLPENELAFLRKRGDIWRRENADMVSEPRKADYFAFVNDLIKKVMRIPNPNDVVWHYTTGENLLKIIESGTLYATQVACLNDSSEVRYSAKQLRKVLEELVAKTPFDGRVGGFLRKYISWLEDTDEFPRHTRLPTVVCCFSSLRDDLSQWRSYCGGENGYAIGIKVNELIHVQYSTVSEVLYSEKQHKELAEAIAGETVQFYKAGLESHRWPNWDEVFLNAWDDVLSYVAPFIKDPGFESEKEVRIIRRLQDVDEPNLRVLQRKTMMSRHLPLSFPTGGLNDKDEKLLPIIELMVGPSRHKAITQASVEALLKAKGYGAAGSMVSKSGRPYQEL